jgi:hypothetical protein
VIAVAAPTPREHRAAPLVQVGQVLRIPEAHYLYGQGELTLRVTVVDPDLHRYPRLEWASVKGVEIRNGTDGQVRQVQVRVAYLRQHRSNP